MEPLRCKLCITVVNVETQVRHHPDPQITNTLFQPRFVLKILVIEDEPKAADYLRKGLTENGYAVEVAHNGTDGLHAAVTGDHDLAILDAMLPGIDGFTVLSALRTSRELPVLMLTARGGTDDKVRGFQRVGRDSCKTQQKQT